MRIVAGQYGGRRLQVPKGRDIRPTSDKIRGAIFNALHSRGAIVDAQVLDVFCGTGALGLEALSRGAAHCTFVDASRGSLDLARSNAEMLGVQADFIKADATMLKAFEGSFDLVFLDPPYNKNLIAPTLNSLHERGLMVLDAMLVIESERSYIWDNNEHLALLDERAYGDTKIFYARYTNTSK